MENTNGKSEGRGNRKRKRVERRKEATGGNLLMGRAREIKRKKGEEGKTKSQTLERSKREAGQRKKVRA